MRILVTGPRGKVGSATVHRLLEAGHRVSAVDRAPAVERARETVYVRADLADAGHLVRRHFGDEVELRPVKRPDASGISTQKARSVLGWSATRSWGPARRRRAPAARGARPAAVRRDHRAARAAGDLLTGA